MLYRYTNQFIEYCQLVDFSVRSILALDIRLQVSLGMLCCPCLVLCCTQKYSKTRVKFFRIIIYHKMTTPANHDFFNCIKSMQYIQIGISFTIKIRFSARQIFKARKQISAVRPTHKRFRTLIKP